MKYLPERIFIDKLSKVLVDEQTGVRISENDIEYIRKDVAEEMAKEFAEFVIDDQIDNDSFDDLFTEFLNSKK